MAYDWKSETDAWEILQRNLLRPVTDKLLGASDTSSAQFWGSVLIELTGYLTASVAPVSSRYPFEEVHYWLEDASSNIDSSMPRPDLPEQEYPSRTEPWRPEEVGALQSMAITAEEFGFRVVDSWPGVTLLEFEASSFVNNPEYADFARVLLLAEDEEWQTRSMRGIAQLDALIGGSPTIDIQRADEAVWLVDGLFGMRYSAEYNAGLVDAAPNELLPQFTGDFWPFQGWRLGRDWRSRSRLLGIAEAVGRVFATAQARDVAMSDWLNLAISTQRLLDRIRPYGESEPDSRPITST